MPMDEAQAQEFLATKIKALLDTPSPQFGPELIAKMIAALVPYIKANAVVATENGPKPVT